jgi:hypothetical protein
MILIPYPRINQSVHQIHDQRDNTDKKSKDRYRALHCGVITQSNPFDQITADTRPGEGGFSQDRAGDQDCHLQTDQSQDGNQRVAQGMRVNQRFFRDAARAASGDKIGAQHLDHVDTRQADEGAGQCQAKRDSRQKSKCKN